MVGSAELVPGRLVELVAEPRDVDAVKLTGFVAARRGNGHSRSRRLDR